MIDFKKAEGYCLPPRGVTDYLKKIPIEDINNLPSHSSLSLKKVIANINALDPNKICIGNGSSEILMFLPDIIKSAGEHLIIVPTYSGFFRVLTQIKNKIHTIALNEIDNFEWTQHTTDQTLNLLKTNPNIKFLWLCSPNNPCGTVIPIQAIETILKNYHGIIVVDEAFVEYIDGYQKNSSVTLTKTYNNLVVLRTFSKIYSLAGLRIGYCIASKQIVDRLEEVMLYYNTSTIAQKCAKLAIKDTKYVESIRKMNCEHRKMFLKALNKINNIKIGSNTKTKIEKWKRVIFGVVGIFADFTV